MSLLFSRDVLPSLYNGLPSDGAGGVKIDNLTDIIIIIANLIQMLITLAGVLAVIFVVWAGIQMITSSGDPKKIADSRNTLTTAVVGLILATGSYLIVDFFARQF
jgi:ABC-type Fe3+ transport system permease subunit